MITRLANALGDEKLPAGLQVAVDVTQTKDGYRALVTIRIENSVGERRLQSRQCDVLADSVALVIALSANRNEPLTTPPARMVLSLSAHGSLVSGPLPTLAPGAGIALALEGWAALRWEISGSYYAGQTTTYDQLMVAADFRLLRVAARSCRVWSIGRLDLAPCAGAALYRIDGAGVGGMVQKSGGSFVWGPELSVLLRLSLWRHFAIQLSGGAALAVSRQRFIYNDLGSLHRPAALAYQVALAPEVLF